MPQGCERAAAEAAALVPPSRGAYRIDHRRVALDARSGLGPDGPEVWPRISAKVCRGESGDQFASTTRRVPSTSKTPEFLDGLSVVRVRTPLPLQRRRHRHRGRHRPRMWTLDLAAGVSGHADRVHRCGARGLDVSRCDAATSGRGLGSAPERRRYLKSNRVGRKDGGVGTPNPSWWPTWWASLAAGGVGRCVFEDG